jgi:hypothetical protein
MAIFRYPNDVLTHFGQTDVSGFGLEISNASAEIQKMHGLQVIVGYHGNDQGDWLRTFVEVELKAFEKILLHFKNATPVWFKDGVGLTDAQIQDYCEAGKVFFTWCDSDNRVVGVMGSGLGLGVRM